MREKGKFTRAHTETCPRGRGNILLCATLGVSYLRLGGVWRRGEKRRPRHEPSGAKRLFSRGRSPRFLVTAAGLDTEIFQIESSKGERQPPGVKGSAAGFPHDQTGRPKACLRGRGGCKRGGDEIGLAELRWGWRLHDPHSTMLIAGTVFSHSPQVQGTRSSVSILSHLQQLGYRSSSHHH